MTLTAKLVVGQEYTSEMRKWRNKFPYGFAKNPVDPNGPDVMIHHEQVKNVPGYVRIPRGRVRFTLRQRKDGYYGENVYKL